MENREVEDCGASATHRVLEELQLYGWRPGADDIDPRPLPEASALHQCASDMLDALGVALKGTRLEPDLEELMWGTINVFHRAIDRVERALDDNEQAQKRSQKEQDGSEILSVELETLTAQGISMIERRNAYEMLRDIAADLFPGHTGSSWKPYSGSKVNRNTLTSAVIDSRDFQAARRKADAAVLIPTGTRIAFSGAETFNDQKWIWGTLDKARAKYPDMVLLHGGGRKGAERIAACWAESRSVAQIVFKPDFVKHQKAAPFKRNDAMLETVPRGVIVTPGGGIQGNFRDKARKMGIPVCSPKGAF